MLDLEDGVKVVVRADQLSSLGLQDGAGDQQVEVAAWELRPEDLRRRKEMIGLSLAVQLRGFSIWAFSIWI